MAKKDRPYALWTVKDNQFKETETCSSLGELKTAWGKCTKSPKRAKLLVDGVWSDITYEMPGRDAPLTEFRNAEERDDSIISNAAYFTVVRFRGVGKYERNQVETKGEALELGIKLSREHKANYMIYAVNKRGYQAFVQNIIYEKEKS